jgi:hypothetical protein
MDVAASMRVTKSDSSQEPEGSTDRQTPSHGGNGLDVGWKDFKCGTGVEANNLNRFLTRTGRQTGRLAATRTMSGELTGGETTRILSGEGVDSERNDELVCLCEKAQTGPELA